MVGRVSVALALVLAASLALAVDAKPVGSLEPAPPTAPGGAMRFAQTHARTRSEAPDWWHYVAPWWSPPEHAPTKEVPDFTEEPMYTHFKNPPKDTMAVYVPYGRDAMSSFVETETKVQLSPRQRMAMTHADDQSLNKGMIEHMKQWEAQQSAAAAASAARPLFGAAAAFPTAAESAALATAPRFMQTQGGAAQAMPPMMPAFPGVPQMTAGAGAFSLPASLQMPMQYTPYLTAAEQYLQQQRQQPQQYRSQSQQPMAPPAPGSAESVQHAIDAKATESSEDARYAQLEDAEFGAHAKLAKAGAPVPRIWRTDRQSAADLSEEEEFEADSDAAQMEAAAQAAQEGADEADAGMNFREKLQKNYASEEQRHASRLDEAEHLREASAAQFDDELDADADADADSQSMSSEQHAAAVAAAAPVSDFRFQQIGESAEEDADAEEDMEDDEENELDEAEDAADAAEQAEADSAAGAHEEDGASLVESHASEADAAGVTEEVIEEIADANGAAANADADAFDNAAEDAEVEAEADALEALNERRGSAI